MGLETGYCEFALREERGRCGDRAAALAPSTAFRRALKKRITNLLRLRLNLRLKLKLTNSVPTVS